MELKEFFTYEVPGARFTPQFKRKQWNGQICLLGFNGRIYRGLAAEVEKFCDIRGYDCVNEIDSPGVEDIRSKTVRKFAASLHLQSGGQAIEPRAYQIEAVTEALRTGGNILVSPTGSGKSLILYLLMRAHLKYDRQVLLVVPSVSLVEQMFQEFLEYGAADPSWSVDDTCHRLYSGKEKHTEHPVLISTYQSLIDLDPDFFARFDVLLIDEAHQAKSKSLIKIATNCKNASFRIGTTGTLSKDPLSNLTIEGLLGPAYQVETTLNLMKQGHLAKLTIFCVILEYPIAERKLVKKMDYEGEKEFLTKHVGRNRFIRKLALDRPGNTLILFQRLKHGRSLYDAIQKTAAAGRKVFFVDGQVDVRDREEIRRITEQEKDAIIVASMGIFSQGVNIKNLHNVIFGTPSKSRIRVLQSIGRGLRPNDDGTGCNLFDIGDDLRSPPSSKRKNITLTHFTDRITIYNEEGFDYAISTVGLV